jgi:single-strand DNA-binding protein
VINKIILIGFLGSDPEARTLENGTMVAKFSVATNESWKDKQGEWRTDTQWHDIVVWRQLAEKAERQLKTGMQVYVEGKLTHRIWEDKDGNKRKTTEVVANKFSVLGKRDETSSESNGSLPANYDNLSFE